ncbi:MAG: hypothetical protein ACEQR5_01950 [Moraxellaceae bacterium]|jgi:hypothetical protein
MSRILLLFIVLFVHQLHAQQNFINVPSSEVTKAKKIFFQQQINFNEIIQSNSTIDFGLGKGFEIGLNVLGLNFKSNSKSFIHNDTNDKDPYNPLLMINGLKQFEFTENLSMCFGTQFGLNYTDNTILQNATLIYNNLLIKNLFIKKSSFVMGYYYNSIHYGGREGNRVGAWFGSEIPINNKLHFVGESIIGNNALSFTSLGLIYFPKKRLPITFGIQIPNTKNNAYSLVFELTFVP